VNVARAFLDRRHQDDVDQLDDWRFLALFGERFGADLLEFFEDLDVTGVVQRRHLFKRPARDFERAGAGAVAAISSCPVARDLAVVLRNRIDHGRFRGDDRLDVVARHELDVVHGEHVRRVRHRDGQRRARPRERDDLVLLRGLSRNELDHCRVDVELPEGNRRHAVLFAEEGRDLVVFDEAEPDQIEAELSPVRALIVQRLLELLRRYALLFEKQLSDSNRHEEETELPQPVTRCHDSKPAHP
jgi:hypothetical protein